MSTPLASETNVNGSENDRRTLGYKRFLRAATWNLRSGINNDGSLELARQVLKDRRLDLLAIPEAGRGGTGCISLHTGEQLIWTGPTTGNPRNKGVALLCSPRAAKCMISKTFVSDRIILASFYMLGRLTMDAVAFYAPHSSHAVDVRQNFRQQLNSLRQQVIRNHFHLELGDANALVGSATPTTPNFGGALGPHGIGEQNLAGNQFLDDCMAAGLCVANTFFQHKRIHKHSLRMFDFQLLEEGEIRPYVYHNNDFVVVRRSFLSSVRDVRVYRGLNGSSQFSHSDHHLVVATIKLRLSAPRRSRPRRDHSVLATDSNARQSYQVAVNTKLAAHIESLPNGASGEVRYDSICVVLKDAADETLPVLPPRLSTQPPASPHLLRLVDGKKKILLRASRNAAQLSRLKALNTASRQESRRLRAAARQSIELDLHNAARHGDQGKAWGILRILSPKRGRQRVSPSSLKDKDGHLLLTETSQLSHLADFYRGLLNDGIGAENEALSSLPNPPAEPTVTHPPTMDSFATTLSRLKNRKAVAPNGISNELLKYAPAAAQEFLFDIVNEFWSSDLPSSCKVTDLISLPKKGDAAFVTNRRGIQVSDKLYQLKSSWLALDARDRNEELLLDNQCGFRIGRGCADQRFTLQCLLDQCRERAHPLYAAFIDLEKAFDRVDRKMLDGIMRSYGYDENAIKAALDLHTDTFTRVKWNGRRSEAISTSWGLQQGTPLSNPLWNLYIDLIFRQARAACGPSTGIRFYYKSSNQLRGFPNRPLDSTEAHLHALLLADDVTALADSPADLQVFLSHLEVACKRWGMKISTTKTKLIAFGESGQTVWPPVFVDGSPLEVVDAVKYLGTWYTANCNLDKELTTRIGQAIGASNRLRETWRSRSVGLQTKLMFYKGLVLPILLHGAESWPLTDAQTKRLDTFHHRCLRQILRVRWEQHISNEQLLATAGIYSIRDRVRQIRMFWLGHVIRMGPSRLPYQALFGQLDGRRTPGRCHTLTKVYSGDLAFFRGDLPNGLPWLQAACDKQAWNFFILRKTSTAQQPAAPREAPPAPLDLPGVGQRTLQRLGMRLTEDLSPGVPDRRAYTSPVGPYAGRPRGRPPLATGRGNGRGRLGRPSMSRAATPLSTWPSDDSPGYVRLFTSQRCTAVYVFLLIGVLFLLLSLFSQIYYS